MGIENSKFCDTGNVYFPVIVITGVCRSGKTLLGNMLATCSNVEYADEPYTAMLLPMVSHTKKVEMEFAREWFATYLCELFNDLLLLRRANFRPNDLSSIWTKKPPSEIFERLTKIDTRIEAKTYAKNKGTVLIITLSECSPFIDFILKALPNVKIVHVLRNGYDVARDVEMKEWFSNEQLLNPRNAQLYTSFKFNGLTWYLPWWVDDGEENYFLSLSEYERCLYYWCSMMEKSLESFQKSKCGEIRIQYEDLVASPKLEFDRISKCLALFPGALTSMKIAEVMSTNESSITVATIDKKLKNRVQLINRREVI